MADQKPDLPKREPKPPPEPPPAPLGSAGASGNPLVHHLLAARMIAFANGDGDGVKDADAALAELGVAVGA
jgi:hypothetical protein